MWSRAFALTYSTFYLPAGFAVRKLCSAISTTLAASSKRLCRYETFRHGSHLYGLTLHSLTRSLAKMVSITRRKSAIISLIGAFSM
ncbi:hypothetical protein Plhal703r1_c35g0129711 [Plasmopara halstedii]